MRILVVRFTIAAVLLPLAVNSGAQTPATQDTKKPAPAVTTIVGCLVLGGPIGQGAELKSDEFFLRTPAMKVPVGGSVTVGGGARPGEATTSAGKPSDTALYRIAGLDAAQLKPHLNHRVELQGRLAGNEDNTTVKTTVDATGRPTTRVSQRMEIAGVLHATSLKMVSASCQ